MEGGEKEKQRARGVKTSRFLKRLWITSHHISLSLRSRSLLTCVFYHTHVLTLQYSDWFIPHFTLYRNHVLSTQEPRFYLLLVVPGGKIFSDMKVFQPGRIVGVLPFPTMRITKFDRLVPQKCKFAAFSAMRITKFDRFMPQICKLAAVFPASKA